MKKVIISVVGCVLVPETLFKESQAVLAFLIRDPVTSPPGGCVLLHIALLKACPVSEAG